MEEIYRGGEPFVTLGLGAFESSRRGESATNHKVRASANREQQQQRGQSKSDPKQPAFIHTLGKVLPYTSFL